MVQAKFRAPASCISKCISTTPRQYCPRLSEGSFSTLSSGATATVVGQNCSTKTRTGRQKLLYWMTPPPGQSTDEYCDPCPEPPVNRPTSAQHFNISDETFDEPATEVQPTQRSLYSGCCASGEQEFSHRCPPMQMRCGDRIHKVCHSITMTSV